MLVRPRVTEAGARGVDETRVAGVQGVPAYSELFHDTGSVVLDQHGGVLEKRVQNLEIGRLLEIERRSAEHTSDLQSLMRKSYAVVCLNKKKSKDHTT